MKISANVWNSDFARYPNYVLRFRPGAWVNEIIRLTDKEMALHDAEHLKRQKQKIQRSLEEMVGEDPNTPN